MELEASHAMLAAAVDRTNVELSSYRFAMLMSFSSPELGFVEIRFEIDGAIDNGRGVAKYTMDMSSLLDAIPEAERDQAKAMFGDVKIDFVQSDGTAYMRFPALTKSVGVSEDWVAVPVANTADAMGAMGLVFDDPAGLLESLRGDATVVDLGPAEVAGVQTTRFQVNLDASDLDPTGLVSGDLALLVG